ncbi:MAG: ribonuclease HII [Acidobacteria bacterium]|nr:ribonuclease HII [Acidobacteriota bacterium]
MSEFQLQAAKQVWTIGFDFEDQARSEGFGFIAGVDEVGRGCLAGPVVAAACILDREKPLPEGLNDSKKLTADQRERINSELIGTAKAFGIGAVEADEIDRINILEATKKAMFLAIQNLSPAADFLLIDALQLKLVRLPQKALIKGDSISVSIAAASIIAKVYRDDLMRKYEEQYPEYGFAGHKGYGCASHFEAIRQHGPCSLHRKTFRGVVPSKPPEASLLS